MKGGGGHQQDWSLHDGERSGGETCRAGKGRRWRDGLCVGLTGFQALLEHPARKRPGETWLETQRDEGGWGWVLTARSSVGDFGLEC